MEKQIEREGKNWGKNRVRKSPKIVQKYAPNSNLRKMTLILN